MTDDGARPFSVIVSDAGKHEHGETGRSSQHSGETMKMLAIGETRLMLAPGLAAKP
jgi:phage portal protein BeeE